MNGKDRALRIFALLSIASMSSVSAAQLGKDVYVQVDSSDFGALTNSITLLLNDSNQQDRFSFEGMNGDQGNDFANRGRNQQGANASGFITPKTDNLNVVPLPPAAFAGFGLLAGVAGIRYLRKSKS